MEAVLLDRHRQPNRHAVDRADVCKLAHERADGKLDAARRRDRRRAGAAGDHERLGGQRQRVRPLADVDAECRRPPDELARHARGIGDAVLAADRRPEHVVGAESLDEGGVDALDRHAKGRLHGTPLLELREPALGRREEEVAHLFEQRRAELREEPDARLREPHLGLGRELLAHAAHRLARGAACDLPHVGQHDVVRAAKREVIRDRSSDRARAGYDDASHPRSSSRSPSLSCRSGRRTSSRMGTPRRPRMNFSAAWRGKRSTAARSSPSSIAPASLGSRTTAATLSG